MKNIVKKGLLLILIIIGINFAFGQKNYSESGWLDYFQKRINELDKIEGIYKVNVDYKFQLYGHAYRTSTSKPVVVTKSGHEYETFTTNGETFDIKFSKAKYCQIIFRHNNSSSDRKSFNYSESSFSVSFDVPNYYVYNDRELRNWLFNAINVDFVIADEAKMFAASSSKLYGHIDYTFEKVFPTERDIERVENSVSSGSGFAISPQGYIVTNSHVIGDGKKIIVRGVNNLFDEVEAKVILNDTKNDLAVLKIETRIENIPYKLKPLNSNVGEDIVVLGYPLRSTMGDEIKLTNGIISSKTGFMGDITSYQISAPVQPGSSGGPLLNLDGEIIGIVNAKHAQAEGATYAVKSMYLYNLLESLPENLEPTLNKLKGKKLSDQVLLIKNFVYIIEAK